jgi:hypothetical protein
MTKRGRHGSGDPGLRRVVAWLDALPGVERVIFNEQKGVRHSRPVGSCRVRARTSGGLLLDGYGNGGILSLFIKTRDVDVVEALIRGKFPERR